MNTNLNTHRRTLPAVAAALGLALAAFASPARANLLVDPGFETNPLTTIGNVLGNFPGFQGLWGVENASIVGVDGGVSPAQGSKMLRMLDDGLVATQAYQVTDVTAYAPLIDSGGATANLSALLNANADTPAAVGSVILQFFSAPNYGSQIGPNFSSATTLDNLPGTWEPAWVSAVIPAGTRWIASQVAFNNNSLQGHPGYVDATDMHIVPEPAGLSLAAAGLLGLIRRRRRP